MLTKGSESMVMFKNLWFELSGSSFYDVQREAEKQSDFTTSTFIASLIRSIWCAYIEVKVDCSDAFYFHVLEYSQCAKCPQSHQTLFMGGSNLRWKYYWFWRSRRGRFRLICTSRIISTRHGFLDIPFLDLKNYKKFNLFEEEISSVLKSRRRTLVHFTLSVSLCTNYPNKNSALRVCRDLQCLLRDHKLLDGR